MNIQSPVQLSFYHAPGMEGEKSLEKAAGDFAAVFAQKLLKYAFKAKGFMGGGSQSQAFYDQLSWQYARVMGSGNQFGMKNMIMAALGEGAEKTYKQQEAMDGHQLLQGRNV